MSSEEDFATIFATYFKQSAAAERIVSDETVWKKMLAITEKLHSEVLVGGNAAIMAGHFAGQGYKSVVSGPIGGTLKQLLSRKNVFSASEILGKSIKATDADEVHIILEYKAGMEINGIHASKPNRFILTRDFSNSRLTGLEEMQSSLVSQFRGLIFN